MTSLSVLDLSPILEGGDAAQSFRNSLDVARHAERWGYTRYWLAEHHNMPGIASAATSVVIGHIANGTEHIRVGSGGIMLPNHSPLVIAEQFGTLASLYPGRIDLGLGRAPGTDQRTAMALRRTLQGGEDRFPRDVVELRDYLWAEQDDARVTAVPGHGLQIPLWILGSSLYGAQLAAMLGLPYAFASHFAPEALMHAIEIYRREFTPSVQLERPDVMAGFNVFSAESDEEGHLLRSSARTSTLLLRTGHPSPLPPPDPDFESTLPASHRMMLDAHGACSAVGAPDTVRAQMKAFVDQTGVDELILNAQIFDHHARLRSFEIAMSVWSEVSSEAPAATASA